MKKYNILYAKRTALWCFAISLPIAALFAVLAFFTDTLERDLVLSFLFAVVGLLLWGINLLRIVFAVRFAKLQMEQLHVAFDARNAKAIYPSASVFLSDNWFIACGRLYLHKDFIQSMTVQRKKRPKGTDYYCVFTCNDRIRTIHIDSSSSVKKIQEWLSIQ